MLIPNQGNTNNVKVLFQYPSNYQIQVSLQQQNQTNVQIGTNPTWGTDASNVIDNNLNANYIPQVIVQPDSSVQQ